MGPVAQLSHFRLQMLLRGWNPDFDGVQIFNVLGCDAVNDLGQLEAVPGICKERILKDLVQHRAVY